MLNLNDLDEVYGRKTTHANADRSADTKPKEELKNQGTNRRLWQTFLIYRNLAAAKLLLDGVTSIRVIYRSQQNFDEMSDGGIS